MRTGGAESAPVREFTYDTLPGALGKLASSVRHDASGDYVNRVTGYDTEYRPTGRETVIPANSMTTGVSGTYKYAFAYTPTGRLLSTTLPAKGGLAAERSSPATTPTGCRRAPRVPPGTRPTSPTPRTGSRCAPPAVPSPTGAGPPGFLNDYTGQLQRTVVDRELLGVPAGEQHALLIRLRGQHHLAGTQADRRRHVRVGYPVRLARRRRADGPRLDLQHHPDAGLHRLQERGRLHLGPRTDQKAIRGPIARAADSVTAPPRRTAP
ncbi:hypothetical protein STANM309S_00198 [Streptomyces tanashiensis]